MQQTFTFTRSMRAQPLHVLWLLVLLLTIGYTQPVFAQNDSIRSTLHPNFFNIFNCFPESIQQETGPDGRLSSNFSEYGHALTPRGTMRVLVIYAGFTNDNVNPNDGLPGTLIPYNNEEQNNPWPQKLNGSAWGESLPRSAANNFYTNLSQFNTSATDQTLSNFYYQMSQFSSAPFKLMAVNFPVRVNVTANTAINRDNPWYTYSRMVLDKIRTDPTLQAHMISLNRGLIDARTNEPGFRSDNTNSPPDGKIDYTIIIWRYANGSPGMNGPNPTVDLNKATGSGGGFASVPVAIPLFPLSSSTLALETANGFTQCQGMTGINHELFVHEFAHTLYRAPHVNGNNGVCGKKFFVSKGNSMTTGNINAWERWFLGWAPLECNGANSDLNETTPLSPGGRYYLRDFITTGDALRIRLPNTYNPETDTYQYLWLENRQKLSVWDQRDWIINGAGQPFPVVPAGIMAYVEDMGKNKRGTDISDISRTGANGLKFLSADGNYDLLWTGTSSTYNNALWGNPIYDFTQVAPNPTGGQSTFSYLRGSRSASAEIGYSTDPNTAPRNEYFSYSAINNLPTYGFTGHNARYTRESKIGLDTNPALTSNPDFDLATQQMKPMHLSGVSVRMSGYSQGVVTVEVRFNDTDITKDTRWTGNLKVWNVPNAANGYDVNVLTGITLRIDRSRTLTRTILGPNGDFTNPTRLNIDDKASLNVSARGVLQIGTGSTLFVEESGRLLAHPTAKIEVEAGALLSVQTQAEADALQQYNQLRVLLGGRLEVRESGTVISGRTAPNLVVFPNPAEGQQLRFALQGVPTAEAATYSYRLLTLYGKSLREGRCSSTANDAIVLTSVPAGTFLLELIGPTAKRLTRRVQVNP